MTEDDKNQIASYYRNMIYDTAVEFVAALLSNAAVTPSDPNIPVLAVEHARNVMDQVKTLKINVEDSDFYPTAPKGDKPH